MGLTPGLTPEESEVLEEYLGQSPERRKALVRVIAEANAEQKHTARDAVLKELGLPVEEFKLIEDQFEKVSPDALALVAVQGLLAGGMDASAVAGIAWKLIVPTFFMEANLYWDQVRLTGSLAPLLAPFVSETSSADYPPQGGE
jgi:hypothetical protein